MREQISIIHRILHSLAASSIINQSRIPSRFLGRIYLNHSVYNHPTNVLTFMTRRKGGFSNENKLI